jgi:hypothetical protein
MVAEALSRNDTIKAGERDQPVQPAVLVLFQLLGCSSRRPADWLDDAEPSTKKRSSSADDVFSQRSKTAGETPALPRIG